MTVPESSKKIMQLLEMKITASEQKLASKLAEQRELYHKAAAVISSGQINGRLSEDLTTLEVAARWQVATKIKAAQFREEASMQQPEIDGLADGLRALMQKKISFEELLKQTSLLAVRAKEQQTNDTLLELENIRRRFILKKV